jgi:hypothetical protein
MFLAQWSTDYVIEMACSENCPQNLLQDIQDVFAFTYHVLRVNLDCKGFRPHDFNKIANKMNLIFEDYAYIAVGQKWAYDDDEHWAAAQRSVRNNIAMVEKLF